MAEPAGAQEATAAEEAVAASGGNGAGRTEGRIAVENPATGETIATVAELGADEVRAMVARARYEQPGWQAAGFEARARILLAARSWLVENAERVITTIVAETGRPADETQFAEFAYGLSALEFWAKTAPQYLADEEIQSASPFVRGRRMVVRYAPVGVVGVIGPWNYPLNNSFGDCIPALAAGNAVVLKPSEVTPLTSLLMAEMLTACGIPEGVFSVATGRGETGAALVDEVDMVMFTGSVATGKKVMAQAAETLTPVSLELGGKDPMIVLSDADLERAANAAVSYGMNNSGQVCISVERIYVEGSVYEDFLARVTEKVKALRQGAPTEPGAIDVGAIIFPPQIELIEAHVRDAAEKGARIVTGGSRGEGPGRFFEPTVIADVNHSMRCMTEETFGPTLPVMRVDDAEEAIRLANDGPYGLQASVWTRDTARGEEIARRIEAGVACVNDAQVNYAALELPMGGWKASGLGSRHGPDGIRKYTKRQSLMVTPGYAPSRDLHMFPYAAEVTQQVGDTFSLLASSDLFSDAQRRTLLAFCDTIVATLDPPDGEDDPTGFWARAASHQSVPEGIEVALLQAGAPPEQIEGLRELLDSLAENGMAPGAPLEAREQIVHAFADSGPDALAGITALRGLTVTLHYALPDLGTGRNPNWEAMGYPGPRSAPPDVPKRLQVRRPSSSEEVIEADVCVVGSGAGGGVVAGELASRGKQVCVLEMGGYFNEADFDQLELPAYQRSYLAGGPFPTAEGQVTVMAGSGLGGGTVINWTNSLRTHPWVREEWAREFGLEGLDGPEYDRHLDAVLERQHATDRCSDLNGPHERLREACEKLGYDFRLTVRNTDPAAYDPESAGYIGFGDQSGSKLSTDKTYLADAQERSADLVANCRAERIIVEGGRAAGIEARWIDPDSAGANGNATRVTVRAPVVVVACGAIESPGLLLRSQIGGPAVGRYLRLHPTGAMTGIYPEDQRWWWGAPQSALSHQFADLEDGYGFLVESAQSTTGIFAAATPWLSARDHKERMRLWDRAAPFINLTRDHGHGQVTIDAAGNPVLQYVLSDELDVRNFHRGLVELVRMHDAAGAEQIAGGGRKGPFWQRGEDLDAFAGAVAAHSLAPREYGIFSAHQMGSCRMGPDQETSVANPWGELHDTKGVWIGDASAFPTASGTNPMVTIMALAHRTAEAIAAA
jgi:acyl-CoA reductase-like NAD-dependent aldehyde dehydrogenase/choline dehydrogenase-like flavoprotein